MVVVEDLTDLPDPWGAVCDHAQAHLVLRDQAASLTWAKPRRRPVRPPSSSSARRSAARCGRRRPGRSESLWPRGLFLRPGTRPFGGLGTERRRFSVCPRESKGRSIWRGAGGGRPPLWAPSEAPILAVSAYFWAQDEPMWKLPDARCRECIGSGNGMSLQVPGMRSCPS